MNVILLLMPLSFMLQLQMWMQLAHVAAEVSTLNQANASSGKDASNRVHHAGYTDHYANSNGNSR